MAEQKQLNTAWLAQLANAHHDGTTQQMAQTVHDLVERLPEEHKQHTDNPSSDNSNNNINN